MKKIIYLGLMLAGLTGTAQVKIGDNPTTIGASSSLELESTNKALVLTRIANTAAITTPVNGMIVYDLSSNCVKAYENGVWSNCLSAGATPGTSLTVDCNTPGLVGDFTNGVALSGASFSVKIINNSTANSTLSFTASDLVLSGASAGITVGTPTPASATLNPGQEVTVVYPLSGTPNTGTETTLTATWTKLTSLTCVKTTSVLSLLARLSDGGFCSAAALNGIYARGVGMGNGNTFTFTITNNSGNTINNIAPPAAGNLVLSGVAATGLTVSVSPTGTFNLANGATRTFTFTISGVPNFGGSTLDAALNYRGYTCNKTKTFTSLQEVLQDNSYNTTAGFEGFYVKNLAFNANNKFKFTIKNNSSSAINNIQPFTASITAGGANAGLSVSTVTPTAPFNLAPNATQTVTVQLVGTPTNFGPYTLTWNYFGYTATASVNIVDGILDRNFGLTINGQQNHNLIYQEITENNGTVWLNNNLGAEYARVESPVFNPAQQATNAGDANAYGSTYQWGRRSDGHERNIYPTSSSATPFNTSSTTNTNVDSFNDNRFYITNANPYDWRQPQNNNLWQGVNGVNNPCPDGFRVPTITELESVIPNTTTRTTLNNTPAKFTTGLFRINDGNFFTDAYYWSSTTTTGSPGNTSFSRITTNTGTLNSNSIRGTAMKVRCIKN